MKKLALSIFTAALFMAATLTASAQEATEQTRNVSGFSGISVSGPFKVHIVIGNTEGVKLNVDAEYIDKVETVVENGTLNIRFKKSISNWGQNYHVHTADVTVNAKALSALANSGSGEMTVDGAIAGSDFKTILSGSGFIKLPSVKVNGQFTARLSGSGSIEVGGNAASVNAQISGSGEIKAKSFSTQIASVTISGSGSVYIKADQKIDATLIGAGNVYYSGTAQINSHKIGSGTVQKMN